MDKTEYEKLCELDRQLQEAICVKRRHQSAGIYDPADEETCKKAADAYNDQYVRVYSRCKYWKYPLRCTAGSIPAEGNGRPTL